MSLKNLYLDFETYYNSKDGYSLRKMPTHDYVRDPRFHPIGVSFGVDDGEVVWFSGDAVAPALAAIPWNKVRLVAHNSLFDAAILSWVYGYKPAAISCTMSMARASGFAVAAGGASLDALAKHARAKGYAMPLKGLEVLKADGKTISDFSPIELAQYGEYCKDDTRIARALDQLMRPALSPAELYWHDTVIRMYTEPALLLDAALLKEELERVIKKRAELLARVSAEHGTAIMSNPKFAAILEGYGVEPPMKISKTTKKQTFAFAKTDEGLTDLLAHEDPRVRAVVEVRLGAKSSIEQTRTETFLALSAAGLMPMGYNISGAHTGRLSGANGNNVQNLPAGRNGQTNALRRSIMAQPGYVVAAVDSSQIEVRGLALMSGNTAKLDAIRQGFEVYITAAHSMWGDDLADLTARYKAKDPAAIARRQLAKSAELGLGYQAGPGGFMNYCRTVAKVDMDETTAASTVATWRQGNATTVLLWAKAQSVLKHMLTGGKGHFGGTDDQLFYYDGARTVFGTHVPGIRLPDGYWLNYKNLRVETDEQGKTGMVYDQTKGKANIPTGIYGGRLIENCLGADTRVLTDKGWVFIVEITQQHKVFDGVEFVSHGGIISKGAQEVLVYDGVTMTPDHLVWTKNGWKAALENPEPDRPCVWGVDSHKPGGAGHTTTPSDVDVSLHLREDCGTRGGRFTEGGKTRAPAIVRMSSWRENSHSWYEQASGVCGLAQHERPLQAAYASGVGKLWRTGDFCVRRVAAVVRGFLARYGAELCCWAGLRPPRQRRGIFQGELPMGYTADEHNEQTEYREACGCARVGQSHRNRGVDNCVSFAQRLAGEPASDPARRRQQARSSNCTSDCILPGNRNELLDSAVSPIQGEDQRADTRVGKNTVQAVYDILNCGPRSRFVVQGSAGPLIVHNCSQSLAGAIIKYQAGLVRLKYKVVMQTHDEIVVVAPETDTAVTAYLEQCFRTVPPWLPDIPLKGEVGVAPRYGDC
jgi:DNA polymerase family A